MFTDVFGDFGSKVILVIVLISFMSCVLSLQAAASRLIYSYARDRDGLRLGRAVDASRPPATSRRSR